jgi:farnesyl diphosphate synthase
MILSLDEFQLSCQKRLGSVFEFYLTKPTPTTTLQEAMSYSVLNGGKRLRSLLVYASGFAVGATWDNLDAPATAIEFIHSYSLVHDDLPAMDNADLRRGKPSCHKAYGEAIAILAGDALQTLAFEILANYQTPLNAHQRLHMMQILAEASGTQGMAAGQTLDILGVHDLSELTQMYALKTGALLSASIKLGIAAADTQDSLVVANLNRFAEQLGLAYQIQDDLLDENGVAVTGKPGGIDMINQKITYVSLAGKEKAIEMVEKLFSGAISAAQSLGDKGIYLLELVKMLWGREK